MSIRLRTTWHCYGSSTILDSYLLVDFYSQYCFYFFVDVYCEDPPSLTSGFTSGLEARTSNGTFPYNTIILYSCSVGEKFEDGFNLKAISCIGQGEWNETEFTCARNTLNHLCILQTWGVQGLKPKNLFHLIKIYGLINWRCKALQGTRGGGAFALKCVTDLLKLNRNSLKF